LTYFIVYDSLRIIPRSTSNWNMQKSYKYLN
jgi:hypothetical protein